MDNERFLDKISEMKSKLIEIRDDLKALDHKTEDTREAQKYTDYAILSLESKIIDIC